MSPAFTDLPVSAATAFAQLQTAAMATELSRDVSHLQGSFASKMVKGSRHWLRETLDFSAVRTCGAACKAMRHSQPL